MSGVVAGVIFLMTLAVSHGYIVSPSSNHWGACRSPSSSSSAVSWYCRRPATSLYFFGSSSDDGSPGDYVCKDCGYVFTKGPEAWGKLDEGKYKCPPCGAPKRRFKKVKKGSEGGEVKVKKSWF